MREVYSRQLAYIVGALAVAATAVFALIQSPETLSSPERSFLAIPHPLDGHEQCDTCHGLRGERPYPVRHLGWSRKSCTKCHRSAHADIPATEAADRTAPGNPHPKRGWEDCISCHAVDSGVKPAPADHEGRTNDVCQDCHRMKGSSP